MDLRKNIDFIIHILTAENVEGIEDSDEILDFQFIVT